MRGRHVLRATSQIRTGPSLRPSFPKLGLFWRRQSTIRILDRTCTREGDDSESKGDSGFVPRLPMRPAPVGLRRQIGSGLGVDAANEFFLELTAYLQDNKWLNHSSSFNPICPICNKTEDIAFAFRLNPVVSARCRLSARCSLLFLRSSFIVSLCRRVSAPIAKGSSLIV